MPFLLADVISHPRVETDDDLIITLAGTDAKAVAQALLQRKIPRTYKRPPGGFHGPDARGHKGADVFARVVVREQKPLAVDVRQMIRVHEAFFRLALTGFAVGQLELLASGGSPGEDIEYFEIQNRLGARAEGNRLLNVGEIERNRVGQRLLHFSDGAQEGFLKARAAILLEGFFRDDQREQLA